MKYKINAEEFAALSEELKKLYEQSGEEYVLKVDGLPQQEDVAELKASHQKLLDEKKAEAEKRRLAEEQARKEAEERAKKQGDFEQLSKSYEQKLQEQESKYQALIQKNEQREIQATANRIAGKIADGPNAEIISEFISKRLKVSEGVVRVTDDAGTLTISSEDQLADEFKSNPRYASLVRGSLATGGGATGSNGTTNKPFKEMNDEERLQLYKQNPEKFNQLVKGA